MLRAREIGSARIMRSRVSKAATGVGLGVALIIAVLLVRGELERWLHHRFLESTVDRAVAVVGIVGLGTVVLAFMRRANVAAAPRAALARRASALTAISVPAAVALPLIVGVAAAFRIVVNAGASLPRVFGDELIYSNLAKSFAATGSLLLRGVEDNGHSILYPILISPLYAVADNGVAAFDAIQVVNAVLMSLTAVPAYFLARKLLSHQLGAVGRRAVGVHSRDLLLGARHVRVALLSGLRHLRARAREHARATHRRSPAAHGRDARRAGRRANAGARAPACSGHRRGAGGVARRAPPTPAHCPLAAVGDSGPRPGRVSGRLQSGCGRAHRGVRRPRAFLRPCRRRQVGAVEPRPVRAQPRRRSRCRLGIERRTAAPTRRVAHRAVSSGRPRRLWRSGRSCPSRSSPRAPMDSESSTSEASST